MAAHPINNYHPASLSPEAGVLCDPHPSARLCAGCRVSASCRTCPDHDHGFCFRASIRPPMVCHKQHFHSCPHHTRLEPEHPLYSFFSALLFCCPRHSAHLSENTTSAFYACGQCCADKASDTTQKLGHCINCRICCSVTGNDAFAPLSFQQILTVFSHIDPDRRTFSLLLVSHPGAYGMSRYSILTLCGLFYFPSRDLGAEGIRHHNSILRLTARQFSLAADPFSC